MTHFLKVTRHTGQVVTISTDMIVSYEPSNIGSCSIELQGAEETFYVMETAEDLDVVLGSVTVKEIIDQIAEIKVLRASTEHRLQDLINGAPSIVSSNPDDDKDIN